MRLNYSHDHLGSVWYHSEPSESPYFPNQQLVRNYFLPFLTANRLYCQTPIISNMFKDFSSIVDSVWRQTDVHVCAQRSIQVVQGYSKVIMTYLQLSCIIAHCNFFFTKYGPFFPICTKISFTIFSSIINLKKIHFQKPIFHVFI